MAKKKLTSSKKKNNNGFLKKLIIALLAIILLSGGSAFFYFYQKVFKANVITSNGETAYLYIKSDASFQDVVNQLSERQMLHNLESFVWLAEFFEYQKAVKPGRYKIKQGMNNKDLVKLLKSGKQEPLRITINNFRTKEILAGKIGALLEADSLSIIQKLSSNDFENEFGLNANQAIAFFQPNTYEFYWNTKADGFIKKLSSFYFDFWNAERVQKAKAMGLTKAEVTTLASIVQLETLKNDEMPRVAGAYLNRLRIGQKLQADPTVVFASQQFTIKRVKGKSLLETDSPYNTYRYAGLPPGPIYLPKPVAIDAVLNAEKHNYFYFCARPDGSGYHIFAHSYEQHLQNARAYHRNLNKRGIN